MVLGMGVTTFTKRFKSAFAVHIQLLEHRVGLRGRRGGPCLQAECVTCCNKLRGGGSGDLLENGGFEMGSHRRDKTPSRGRIWRTRTLHTQAVSEQHGSQEATA